MQFHKKKGWNFQHNFISMQACKSLLQCFIIKRKNLSDFIMIFAAIVIFYKRLNVVRNFILQCNFVECFSIDFYKKIFKQLPEAIKSTNREVVICWKRKLLAIDLTSSLNSYLLCFFSSYLTFFYNITDFLSFNLWKSFHNVSLLFKCLYLS